MNFQFLSSKKGRILIFILLCFVSLLLQWSTSEGNPLWGTTSFLFSPIQDKLTFVLDKLKLFLDPVSRIWALPQDNARLKEKLYLLGEERDHLKEVAIENSRLRKLLDFQEQLSYKTISAQLISIDPSEWFRYITINKGSKHGVSKDDAVITYAQLDDQLTVAVVGRIADTSLWSSKVQLITDRSSRVAVRIQDSRHLGILRGQSGTENCIIEEIPATANVEKGDRVVVGEISPNFPKGMLVGKAISVESDESSHFLKIVVKPAASLETLGEVLVVKR